MLKYSLLLSLFIFMSCTPAETPADCEKADNEELCTVTPPAEGGETTGGTTGGTTGSTTGDTTGGSTGGTSGGITGSTVGGTTGGTSGGTTGSTTGGTTGGSSGVPNQALTWDADIYFANFNATQEKKVTDAVALMKKVIASEEFKTRVLEYTYNGKKQFVDNGGFTNAQVYQKILDGAETLQPTKNNKLDVELELYYSLSSTIGYTYANSTRIWMNTKYFNSYTPVNISDNLMHEWMHKLGFSHASSWSASRDHSVPYAIGYLMEELAKKY